MLDGFCYLIGIMAALWAVALIAFPELLTIENPKKKSFKVRHWGQYEGGASAPDEEEIEVQVPARKKRAIVGSQTYEAGRGISFRQ